MSAGIYDENLVAHLDSVDAGDPVSQIQLISATSGPSGQVVLPLSDGVSISMDYATPSVMTSITVVASETSRGESGVADSDVALLRELIGDLRAEQSLRVLDGSDRDTVRIESSRDGEQYISRPTRGSKPARELGFAGLLLDAATDDREALVVRLVAALESVSRIRNLGASRVVSAIAARAQEALITLDEEDRASLPDLSSIEADLRELAERDPKNAFMVHRLIEDTIIRLDNPAARIVASWQDVLGRFLSIGEADTVDDVVDRWRAEQPEFLQSMMLRSMVVEETVGRFEMAPMHDSSRYGRWEMIWTDYPGGSWVRILDPDDQLLVGLVPVRKKGKEWIAEAIVPPHHPTHHWLIEVTDVPLPDTGASRIDQIIEAVRLGRIAARLSARLSPKDRAVADAWNACAEAWRAAGDETREGRARALARQGRIDCPIFLADRVRAELRLEHP